MADIFEIRKLLTRAVERVYPGEAAVLQTLKSGRRLAVYLGVDPTGPHLHLGHATNLLLLRRFQELGHRIYLLLGDFTARIGDPTDRLAVRQPLTPAAIKANLKTFKQQAGKILRFTGQNAAQIKFNSRWLAKLPLADFLALAGQFTVEQILERAMFKERLKAGKPVWLTELIYPLLQGYDSVALEVDVEIGGSDQTFNMLVGRDLLKSYLGREKLLFTTKLLVNPKTGRKLMNKSEGGLVNLDDPPDEMYGQVMALPDEAIVPVAELATDLPDAVCVDLAETLAKGSVNPRDLKMRLARAVVNLYCGAKAATAAESHFIAAFQQGQPEAVSEAVAAAGASLFEILQTAGLVKSKSDWRRLVVAGAVELDGERMSDPHYQLKKSALCQIGKRRFLRLRVE
ncbi:MAG: tyrosine--tRNA ligase [Candidatus Vogelbacteria bacterium]|nr:tyrosine--tRNA ligase [Candidatus Vogelbacteria bacterium]